MKPNEHVERAPRKKHIVQIELHMALKGARTLDDVLMNAASRSREGMRSKLVVAFETEKPFPKNFFPQDTAELTRSHVEQTSRAKERLHKMLIEKLEAAVKTRTYDLYIERSAGSTPELLRSDEYHETIETVRRVDPSAIWAFVFANSREEYVRGFGENTDKLTITHKVM